jgi:Fe-Mn family superoxide dismutase
MIYCLHSNQERYPFKLPDLPYPMDGFKELLSTETFVYHHGKHHNTYVVNLNKIISDTGSYLNKSLEEIIIESYNKKDMPAFNNAAQVWNHTFLWNSMSPNGGGKPQGTILKLIEESFGSYESFVEQFRTAALGQFGSGWVWLVLKDKKLEILKTANAETPITQGLKPLLTCDVWEHAYYIDYRNKRLDYVNTFINNLINWDFVSQKI